MFLERLDRHLMPPRCVFCGTRVRNSEGRVCTGCRGDLPYAPSPPPPLSSPFVCELAPFAYAFPVDAAIRAFKFRRRTWYAPAFAELMLEAARALPADVDAMLPVPLHWRRKWWRGFNQAAELARPMARHLDLPLVTAARRRRATPPQSGLSAAARSGNLRAAFLLRHALPYRHVVIVDDVITTGATVRELARELRRGGVSRISVLALARAVQAPGLKV